MPAKRKGKSTKKDSEVDKKSKVEETPEEEAAATQADQDLKKKILDAGHGFDEPIKYSFKPKNPAKAPKGLTFPLKLAYFPLRALAENVKLVLEYAQVPYDFIGDEKEKEATTFGSLPYVHLEGSFPRLSDKLVQSGAIVRYLGGKFGLDLKSAEDKALVDVLFEQSKDLGTLSEHLHSSNKESDGYKKFVRYLEKTQQLLPEGQDTFFEKVTYADLALFNVLQTIEESKPGSLVDDFKVERLEKFRQHVAGLPSVAAYLKSARRLPGSWKELRIPGWEKVGHGGYEWYIPSAAPAADAAAAPSEKEKAEA